MDHDLSEEPPAYVGQPRRPPAPRLAALRPWRGRLRWMSLGVAALLVAGGLTVVAWPDDRQERSLTAGRAGARPTTPQIPVPPDIETVPPTTSAPTELEAPVPTVTPTSAPLPTRAPATPGGPRPPATTRPTTPPTAPRPAPVASGTCSTDPVGAVDSSGLWVLATDGPPRRITDHRIESFRWAPDADRLAWISGDALHVTAARTGRHDARALVRGWQLLPRLGWTDKSDGVIFAGVDPSGRSGVWLAPVDGGTPRPLLATASKPVDLAVGGEGPWGGLGPDEYRWSAAVVADGRVSVVSGRGGTREVATGAYDTVAVDRGGENVAFGGPDGAGVSLYPSQPGRIVISRSAARPAEFGYTGEWLLLWLGDVGSTLAVMHPDGRAQRELVDAPQGFALSNSGRDVYVGRPGGGIVVKSLGGGPGGSAGPTEVQPDRELSPAGRDPVASPYGPVAWLTSASNGRLFCLAPDGQSTNRRTLGSLGDGLVTSRLRPRWTGPSDAFGGHHLAGLVAVVAD